MEMMSQKNALGGIYLVIDPAPETSTLLHKIEFALRGGISILQIWDNFANGKPSLDLIEKICLLCHACKVPVLINNHWELLAYTKLDGVHFDTIPDNYQSIREEVGREFLTGLTCGNNLEDVVWAENQGVDYISFCSMFSSSTSNSCELVAFETVQKAHKLTQIPIFLAGGIKPENIELLKGLPYSGIAVVSGIMSAENPHEALQMYHQKINQPCD